jgi:hypothetical protein
MGWQPVGLQQWYTKTLVERATRCSLVCGVAPLRLVVGMYHALTGDLTTPSAYDTISFRGFNRSFYSAHGGCIGSGLWPTKYGTQRAVSFEWDNRKRTRPSCTHRAAVGEDNGGLVRCLLTKAAAAE